MSIILILFGIALLLTAIFVPSIKATADGRIPSVRITPLMRTLGGALGVFLLLSSCLRIVSAGHVGIVVLFGNVSDSSLDDGMHVVNPLADLVELSVRTDEIKEDLSVPTKEGMNVGLEASILYHVESSHANELYRSVGENFQEKLIEPFFRSIAREVTSRYDSKALYTSERDKLQGMIEDHLRKVLAPRGIVVEGVPLRKMTLPESVQASIAAKVSAEQDAQRMAFVLQRETQEAERKIIEARGDSVAQAIINSTISDRYLQLKGIDATNAIAKSSNAKIIIIGNTKNGLPLVMQP